MALPPKSTTKIIKKGRTIEKLKAEMKFIVKIGSKSFQFVTNNINSRQLKGTCYSIDS